jgi:hypothetical protein
MSSTNEAQSSKNKLPRLGIGFVALVGMGATMLYATQSKAVPPGFPTAPSGWCEQPVCAQVSNWVECKYTDTYGSKAQINVLPSSTVLGRVLAKAVVNDTTARGYGYAYCTPGGHSGPGGVTMVTRWVGVLDSGLVTSDYGDCPLSYQPIVLQGALFAPCQ